MIHKPNLLCEYIPNLAPHAVKTDVSWVVSMTNDIWSPDACQANVLLAS